MSEHQSIIKFAGKDSIVLGPALKPGDTAPEFVATDQDWSEFPALKNTIGKVRIIAAVPSLDTSVCDRETRRFNQAAAAISEDIVIMIISTDLPFAQKRWCGSAGIDQVKVVSDHKNVEFGTSYGCLITDPRVLRRAVFIIDRDNKIAYAEYTPTLGDEPDYETILSTARAIAQKK